jgi:DNA polymerase-3 subunit gamma/tau
MADAEIKQDEYRVLARKYRPQNFDELIGQDALVTTLKNAIDSGRIAHAFMLTGIRGTGKTTTARIIAKALNYTGADGSAGPTTGDTSDCDICNAIGEDRHPDVMEMDAASRTGVDDIREILDGVRYAPTSARYKIYIIDEVHMLSKNAFNALLKTLEEPPSNVKFIFATTEIRKVPVTILSRCQRFDLRRVDVPTLSTHYGKICDTEGFKIDDESLSLIAQSADGSVRDGLSLLDQAMALATDQSIKEIDVAAMLGATDKVKVLDLLDHILGGKPKDALDVMQDLYKMGADPRNIIQDMMDMIHAVSLMAMKVNEGLDALPHSAIDRAKTMASQLTTPQLQKSWQLLMKGLGELHNAPNPQKAAEMIVLRLTYAADLPDPSDLIKKIKEGKINLSAPAQKQVGDNNAPENAPQLRAIAGGGMVVESAPMAQSQNSPETLQSMIKMFEDHGEMMIASHLYQDIACVTLKAGHFEFKPYDNAPADLAGRVRSCLSTWTGDNWMVSVARDKGNAVSLAEQKQAHADAQQDNLKSQPNVKAVLDVFPDAEIIRIFNKDED